MSEGMNRVYLLGNLGQDPELRMTSGGNAVLSIRLAVSERYKDRNGEWKERTEWATVVVFGKRAEGLSKLLQKGDRIAVEGSLRTSSYDDRDGNKRYKTEVNAREVILCGGRGKGGQAASDEPSDGGYSGGDEFPF